jgi:hypothetical protein
LAQLIAQGDVVFSLSNPSCDKNDLDGSQKFGKV